MARILGPGATGLTAATITLVTTYTINAHFGILNALSQRFPTLMGVGTPDARAEAAEMLRVALGGVVIAALISAAVVFMVAIWHSRDGSALASMGLCFAAVIGALQLVKTYYIFVVRATNKFAYLSRYSLCFSWVPLAWLVGARWGGVVGQWTAMTLTELAMGCALYLTIGRDIRWKFNVAASWRYIRIGLPIYAVGTLFIMFTSLDRVATAWLLGTTALGLYGIASMASTVLALVPGILTQIMWPRIAEMLGASGPAWRDVLPLIEKPSFLVAFLLPPVIGIFVLVLPPVTVLLLPKYVAGVPAAQVALISVFFLGLMGMYGVFLGTSLRLLSYGLVVSIGTVMATVGFFIGVRSGHGLVGIAWTKTASYALVALGLMVHTWREFGLSAKQIIAKLSILLTPMAWVYWVSFWAVPRVSSLRMISGAAPLASLAVQVMVLGVLTSPVVWIGLHRGGIAQDIAEMLRRRTTAPKVAS